MPPRHSRHILFGLALALGARAVAAAAAERYHVSVSPLAADRPGLYLVHSYGSFQGQKTEANGLIVSSGTCVALLDTAWGAPQTRELLDWVDSNLHHPVRFAVITHAHADRIGGISVLRSRGIATYGNALTADAARRAAYPAPDRLFRREISLRCGDFRLELFYPGPGHTRDNIAVYIQEAKTLYGGCFLKSSASKTLGNIDDADLAAWPDSLETLARRFPEAEVVIPGHGGLAAGAIAQTRALLREQSAAGKP